mmetsp:Transcript_133904/g.189237  ORF Transcript_133904/g.189237 Transcript_133904/m.189237 type:complete len:254 (+) Transcript_133904:598-1359(+)
MTFFWDFMASSRSARRIRNFSRSRRAERSSCSCVSRSSRSSPSPCSRSVCFSNLVSLALSCFLRPSMARRTSTSSIGLGPRGGRYTLSTPGFTFGAVSGSPLANSSVSRSSSTCFSFSSRFRASIAEVWCRMVCSRPWMVSSVSLQRASYSSLDSRVVSASFCSRLSFFLRSTWRSSRASATLELLPRSSARRSCSLCRSSRSSKIWDLSCASQRTDLFNSAARSTSSARRVATSCRKRESSNLPSADSFCKS